MNSLIVNLSVVLFVLTCTVVFQYITRSFSDMNTNPAPERTWSLSSKNVKALSHASGSDQIRSVSVNISLGTCS